MQAVDPVEGKMEEKGGKLRGFRSEELTSYANLVLKFKHVGGTPGLLKRTENGQKLVFVQSSYVVMHIHRGYHVYIPGYIKTPLVDANNLVKSKFKKLVKEADLVFIPIVIIYTHAKNFLRKSYLTHNTAHTSLVVYRKKDKRYFIMDCLLNSRDRLKSYIVAMKVQQRVIPFFRKTFKLEGTSKKCLTSRSFPINNGCGIFVLWCVEKFMSDPTWTPEPYIVFPPSGDLLSYTKAVMRKLLLHNIDLTKDPTTEEEKEEQKDKKDCPRLQNSTEIRQANTNSTEIEESSALPLTPAHMP
ncbi:unnamed protein product [Orchesella dallaii]|uniref:Ubiquitin-like protease family profile domain-containing protein n=1 Tax=Orchesella dallaii TaxID=48710 RepID=A0ABP1RAL2_9HEXA